MNKKPLQGRVVAMTGASKGVGLGIIQHGAQVVGGERDISGAAVARANSLRETEIRPGMVDTFLATPSRRGRQSGVAGAVPYTLSAPAHVRFDEMLLHPVTQDVAH